MDRYPHKVLIQKPDNTDTNQANPWAEEVEYIDVYSGQCRCYLNAQSRFRTNKVMDSDFCVTIPDPKMIDIGENYRVCVKYPNSPSKNPYNVIGFVKDFVRYDRNCLIHFQVIKENMIAEDMPEE